MEKEVKLVKDLFDHHTFNTLKSLLHYKYKEFPYFKEFGRYEIADHDLPELKEYTEPMVDKAREIFNSDTLEYTYSLLAHYEGPEANLFKHTDTNACTYTLDVCLYQNVQWPLIIEDVEYKLEENEALAFYGEDQEHWRPEFPNPDWNNVGMIFLHFAEPDHWFFKKKI
jgi:hypothetical protein